MVVLEIAESGKYISVSRGHIIISQKREELAKVPIDSILSLVLSAEGIQLSKNLLVRMAEENIPVIICGKNYMPISILSPLDSHYKMLPIAEKQIKMGAVLKKQVWQKIVQNKILNQHAVLKHYIPQSPVLDKILKLSEKVRSGDSDNKEAQAARLYFSALFGKGFIRDVDEEGINAFLNYGYAVVRATFARAICACGLLPLLGVKHHNVYNAFCLVDDMMEICRPLVDFYVYAFFEKNQDIALTPEAKRKILRFIEKPLLVNNQEMSIVPASVKYVQAFVNSIKNNIEILPQLKIIFDKKVLK